MVDFFDRVKEGISRGVTTVSIKSKEMLEANKIKGQIDSLQRQRKNHLEELGIMVYTMFREGKTCDKNAIQDKCEAILNLETQIEGKEKELEQIHLEAQEALKKQKTSQHTCTCGAEIPLNAKFCGKCGKKIDEVDEHKEENQPQGKSCPECGAFMSNDARFCGKCGTKL